MPLYHLFQNWDCFKNVEGTHKMLCQIKLFDEVKAFQEEHMDFLDNKVDNKTIAKNQNDIILKCLQFDDAHNLKVVKDNQLAATLFSFVFV
jgi:hypothetical protein